MLKEIHRPTRVPAKLFELILSADYKSKSKNNEKEPNYTMPTYCIEIPHVVLTPTRLFLQGFSVEISNRITRQFDNIKFVRLGIADEDMTNMFSDNFSDEICERIKGIILNGITLNDCHFRFLAYSSSQLKEKSMWMVSCSSRKKDYIRSWMGDFNNIKLPSKYAARMGQCFSTTIQTLSGNSHTRESSMNNGNTSNHLRVCDDYDDIGVGDFCHSDGTGLICQYRLKEALTCMPFAPTDLNDVSIVQIRFGGAKGTLTSWDFEKIQGLKNRQSADVYLRPSMVKFKAPYHNLEIISIGR